MRRVIISLQRFIDVYDSPARSQHRAEQQVAEAQAADQRVAEAQAADPGAQAAAQPAAEAAQGEVAAEGVAEALEALNLEPDLAMGLTKMDQALARLSAETVHCDFLPVDIVDIERVKRVVLNLQEFVQLPAAVQAAAQRECQV